MVGFVGQRIFDLHFSILILAIVLRVAPRQMVMATVVVVMTGDKFAVVGWEAIWLALPSPCPRLGLPQSDQHSCQTFQIGVQTHVGDWRWLIREPFLEGVLVHQFGEIDRMLQTQHPNDLKHRQLFSSPPCPSIVRL